MAIERRDLGGGDAAVLVEGPCFGAVTVRLVWLVGASSDGAFAGVSSVAMELMLLGTARRSRASFHAALERLGAQLDTRVSRRTTIVELQALAPMLGAALELVGEALCEPLDSADELENLLREIDEGAETEVEDPAGAAGRYLSRALWPRQAWGRPVDGRRVDRAGLTPQRVTARRRRLLAAPLVAGVGADRPDEVWPHVARLIARVRSATTGVKPAVTPRRPEPAWGTGAALAFRSSVQGALAVVTPAPPPASEAWPAVSLNATAFGGGFTSPLVRAVRARDGLAYELDWSLSPDVDGSLHTFRVYPEGARLPEAYAVARACWEEWAATGPTDEALETAKAMLVGAHLVALETVAQRLGAALMTCVLGLDVDRLWKLPTRIASLGRDEVAAAAARYAWSWSAPVVVAALPRGANHPAWSTHPAPVPIRAARISAVI
ncbi:MAG: insulinase family protein [Myxococcales bacterium]|nr:insulinase family protein [Myxococcales bacterium]